MGKSDDKQLEEEAPPVQVEALDDVGLGGEKRMPFRKAMDSEADIEGFEPSDSTYGKPKTEDQTEGVEAVETEHEHIKQLFFSMMDAQPKVRVGHIFFTWTEPNDCQMTFQAWKQADQQQ